MNYRDNDVETRDVKIEDVKPLDKNINVIFTVIEQGEAKEITKRDSYDTNRVCDFTVADDSGKITLALWNEDIDALEKDKTYKLSNCFVNIFHNTIRLSKGKYGTLEADSTSFDKLNEDNDRSSESHEDPRRRYSDRGGGGRSSRGGGDRNRQQGGGGNYGKRW